MKPPRTFPLQADIRDVSARFSPCRRYRYELHRRWAEGPTIAWVGLNPSTATAQVDDPTVRRCITFSRAWGAGAMVMLNLFALRSTDPKGLRAVEDPVGPENDAALEAWARRDAMIVAAWGNHGALNDRAIHVLARLGPGRIHCLGITGARQPVHPLYQPGNLRPTPWSEAMVQRGPE